MSPAPGPAPVPDLTVDLGPLRLAHPLINASGTMEIFELAEALGPQVLQHPSVAAYVPKTVTLHPRRGNPSPRILETAGGMINAIGLAGEGLEAFIADRLPRLLALPCPIVVSVGGFSPQEYVALASGLRLALEQTAPGDRPWTSQVGLELNISCPNVHTGCASIGSDPVETADLVAAVRGTWPGLLIAKLTPNVTDIAAVGRAAAAAGADALAAVNTFKGLVIDRETLRPYLGNLTGGLSGPAIRPLALRAVYELYGAVEVPLVGMGGVGTVQDVLDFMACGARVVAVGSCGFRDPLLAGTLAQGLAAELRERGLTVDMLVGRAHGRPTGQ
jgi:dihydroorotate dehydrogenase (NAD+) catalytic subunit